MFKFTGPWRKSYFGVKTNKNFRLGLLNFDFIIFGNIIKQTVYTHQNKGFHKCTDSAEIEKSNEGRLPGLVNKRFALD